MRLPHPEILNTLSVGDTLLLDDGKLRMVVTAKHDGAVDTVVEVRPYSDSHWQETVESSCAGQVMVRRDKIMMHARIQPCARPCNMV